MSNMIESPTADTGPGMGAGGGSVTEVLAAPSVEMVVVEGAAVEALVVEASVVAREVVGLPDGGGPDGDAFPRATAPRSVAGEAGWDGADRWASPIPSSVSNKTTRATAMTRSMRLMVDIRFSLPCSRRSRVHR
jgi:hypothetical protein